MQEIKKELGDLLLHIVFYAKIGSEQNTFDIGDVANEICEKLINRHPHIYGDTKVDGADQVIKNWESIKLKEGKSSVLEGVPKSLPALVKAFRIQEKAAGVGFEWDNAKDVLDKVKEEITEFNQEVEDQNHDKMEDEFGDVIFSLINYARYLKINPESALERTNKKFIKRFKYIEESAKNEGKVINELTLDQMEAFWNKAKNIT